MNKGEDTILSRITADFLLSLHEVYAGKMVRMGGLFIIENPDFIRLNNRPNPHLLYSGSGKHPTIDPKQSFRIENRVYVYDINKWIIEEKGLNDDTLEIMIGLAKKRGEAYIDNLYMKKTRKLNNRYQEILLGIR